MEDIEKWGRTFIRVYELQGPAAFGKYQYSIANVLSLKTNTELGEQLLKYIRHIPNPKDMLFEVLIDIMLNGYVNTNCRILALEALAELFPKRMPYSRYTQETIIQAMEDAVHSPQTLAFRNAVKDVLKSMNVEIQKGTPKHTFSQSVAGEVT